MDSPPTAARAGGSTRRAFIARSTLLGGAAWLAATGWHKTVGRAVAAISSRVAEKRRRDTYVALVDAVAGPGAGTHDAIVGRFDGWYTNQLPFTQRIADSILDDVSAQFAARGAQGGPKFHEADRSARLEFARAMKYGRGPRPTSPGASGSAEVIAGKRALAKIREYASNPDVVGDPTDVTTLKPPPPDRTVEMPSPPTPTGEEVHASSLMAAALTLVAAPLYVTGEDDPESLAKVPPLVV